MHYELVAQLLQQLNEPFTGEVLFDAVDDTTFFMKDRRGRYVLVNRTLAKRCGSADKTQLLGRTAAEVFPPPLGDAYLAQDLELIATGEPLLNELELHTYATGEPGWCLTTKQPLRNAAGECIGLVGLSRDLYPPTNDYGDVAAAIHEVRNDLEATWTVDEMARLAKLSAYQFDQRIREAFHLSANQLVLKLRMDRAVQRLRDSTKPIVQIALECGYSDQSAFTRQFRRTIGLAPSDFRRLHAAKPTGT
jgi:PAS domain S-box-containing protein